MQISQQISLSFFGNLLEHFFGNSFRISWAIPSEVALTILSPIPSILFSGMPSVILLRSPSAIPLGISQLFSLKTVRELLLISSSNCFGNPFRFSSAYPSGSEMSKPRAEHFFNKDIYLFFWRSFWNFLVNARGSFCWNFFDKTIGIFFRLSLSYSQFQRSYAANSLKMSSTASMKQLLAIPLGSSHVVFRIYFQIFYVTVPMRFFFWKLIRPFLFKITSAIFLGNSDSFWNEFLQQFELKISEFQKWK